MSFFSERRQRLSHKLQYYCKKQIITLNKENIYYLTGFISSNAILLQYEEGKTILITDSRYSEKAQALCQKEGIEFILWDEKLWETLIPKMASEAIIENTMSLEYFELLKSKCNNIAFSTFKPIIEELRGIKEAEEISKIEKAQEKFAVLWQNDIKNLIKEGKTEKEIAWEIESFIRRGGEYELSFPVIVAFGANSSHPHHQNSDRRLKKGENILIDCGAQYEGYCSDMTRNIFYGAPSAEYLEKYQMLLAAQEATLEKIRPGASCRELDLFCRDALGEEAKYFTHSLGHGVGLEIHETPSLSSRKNAINTNLEAGMIITIEPGLYYPGNFGIRIEDLVLVTPQGYELISKTPKDLLVID